MPFREIREPDRFWYAGPFAEASDALLAATTASTTPTALLGPRGSGRTFLLETLSRRVQASRAVVVNPSFLMGQPLAHAAAIELGIRLDPALSPAEAFDALLQVVLRDGAALSLLFFCVDGISDDLEGYNPQLLAMMRSAPPWVRFVVATEPERADELAALGLQPVIVRPMTSAETEAYVTLCLGRVARTSPPHFDPAVHPFLHARSGGLVRTVGVFVHNALQVAACLGSQSVSVDALRIGMKSKVPLSPADARNLLAREGR